MNQDMILVLTALEMSIKLIQRVMLDIPIGKVNGY
jgi:hypothetical protein